MKQGVRPGGRSARVRADVLAATLAVLRERGFAGLTFESVADRAGVHRTTLHRRWPTRTELLADAMLDVSAKQVPVPDTGQLRSDLRRFALEVREALAAPVSRAIVAALAGSSAAPELREVARRFWTARFAATRQIIERAVDRGEVPADTDPRLVVEALGGPIWFRTFVVGDRADDRFVDRLVDLVIAGTGGTPP
jgi:AcrR family transcriptional regulator